MNLGQLNAMNEGNGVESRRTELAPQERVDDSSQSAPHLLERPALVLSLIHIFSKCWARFVCRHSLGCDMVSSS